MELSRTELQQDLDAAVQTRKELGPEYEAEIVDSFLARIDARLDARVEQRVAERVAGHGPSPRHPGHGRSFSRLPAISLVLAIPLSAVGGGTGGMIGLLAAWAGIVGVNVAAALGARQEDRDARRRRDGWE